MLPWSKTDLVFVGLSLVFWTSSGCLSLFVLKKHRLTLTFLYLTPSHSFITIINPFIYVQHFLFFNSMSLNYCICCWISRYDTKRKQKKKKKIKTINHLTLFFNICRFVLLFPTFLQQKGLSNSLRIRRACWLKTKESPCFANPDREELKPVTALPLLRFFAFRVMRRACTVWNR